MIIGIGIDIESTNRFRKMKKNILEKVLKRILTEKELKYCLARKDPFPCITGRFCAKEAFLKALGFEDFHIFEWKEMEIIGKPPKLNIYGKVKEILGNKKIKNIWVSISHTSEYATAIVILEK